MSLRRSGLLVLCSSLLLARGFGQLERPLFWRGVYLFGLPQPTNGPVFFSNLSDSLHLNLFQVRTFGIAAGKERNEFFLRNPKNLKVVNQSTVLATASDATDAALPDRLAESIESETRALAQYSNNFRFYLADEPDEDKLDAFASTSKRVQQSHKRAKTVTALLADHDRFVKAAGLSEVLVETYFLKNDTPHPSLVDMDSVSTHAGIVAWGDSGYAWYLGGLQQHMNEVLAGTVRPAAETAQESRGKVRLIFVPQLHGVLDSTKKKYDRDDDLHNNLVLRPPSPAEIRVQYYIGLAYGARGFLAYPYGFDAGYERSPETYPGLVSGDPSQVNHSSNFDTLYGKPIWTGYHEKWLEVAAMNKRLEAIGQTLLCLNWIGAKSWTMDPREWKPMTVSCGKWNNIVTGCSATTLSGYRDDLPQVEIGHLRSCKSDYIVVVNRRCSNEDTAQVTIVLNDAVLEKGKRWKVTDIGRRVSMIVSEGQSFMDRFDPGAGKIYRLSK